MSVSNDAISVSSNAMSARKHAIRVCIFDIFQVDIERNITILKDREAELQKAITELDEQGDIDVDEAVTTTAPLYKQ